MNRKAFTDAARTTVFKGAKYSVPQVQGIDAILDEAERRGTPLRHLAYMLATPFHETGATMQPIIETRQRKESANPSVETAIARLESSWKRGKLSWVKTPYWRKDSSGKSWLGRGLVQLTHKANYEKLTPYAGVDLVKDPSLAMTMPVAIKIMFEGMERGLFTGAKLSDHISPAKADYYNARRIINGVESASTVAVYAKSFEAALIAAGYDAKPSQQPVEPKAAEPATPAPATVERQPSQANWLSALISAIANIIKGWK